jgi:hypothetical protein
MSVVNKRPEWRDSTGDDPQQMDTFHKQIIQRGLNIEPFLIRPDLLSDSIVG